MICPLVRLFIYFHCSLNYFSPSLIEAFSVKTTSGRDIGLADLPLSLVAQTYQ